MAINDEARAMCARLPALPPFDGGSEFAHNDPIIFAALASSVGAGSTGSMGPVATDAAGYDFVFPAPPDSDLVCVICSLVCRDAVETACSHIFCSQCLSKWMERKRECVTCRTPLPSPADVRPSGFIRRKVLGLLVACPHSAAVGDSGGGGGVSSCCDWQGEIRYLSSHLRRECEMQRMKSAAESFVQAKPDRYASLAEWGGDASNAAASSSASAASSSDAIAIAASALFPPPLLGGLSLGALYRLASALAVHTPLQGERWPHAHLANSTPLWNHWIATRASVPPPALVNFMAVEPHASCNHLCILPPMPDAAWVEGQDESQDELQARSVRSWILSAIIAARRQYLSVYSACFVHLQSCPVRVLSAFLSAKGLSDAASFRGPAGTGVEKVEMVEACMTHRHRQDVHAADAARSKPAAFQNSSSSSSSHAGFGAAAAPPLDGAAALLHQLQGMLQGSGVQLDPAAFGGHLSAHAAMHGAMSGDAGSNPHFDHHLQHLSWGLAAQQQGLHGAPQGMGINVATLGNGGVVVSMHMPPGAQPLPQAFQPQPSPLRAHDDENEPAPSDAASAAFAQAMMAHAAQHRLAAEARLAELDQNQQEHNHAADVAEEPEALRSGSMRSQSSYRSAPHDQPSPPQPAPAEPALMFRPRQPAQYSHVPPAATARQATRPRPQQRQQQQQQPMEKEPVPVASCCSIM